MCGRGSIALRNRNLNTRFGGVVTLTLENNTRYNRSTSIRYPASVARNVSEPSLMSRVERVRAVSVSVQSERAEIPYLYPYLAAAIT